MFAALLDTNVLWPSLQRDFLLSLSVEGLYRPLWSEAILDELEFHEARKLHRCGTPQIEAEERAAGLIRQMQRYFGDAVVDGWEQVRPYGLPDPDDEHVLAAAVVGGAGVIVTENVADFPRDRVPPSIAVVRAAPFARDTVDVDPPRAAQALREMSRRRSAPPQTPTELAGLLKATYGMDEAVDMLQEHL